MLKKRKTDHITLLFQFLHWLLIQQRIQYKKNLSAKNISWALLRLISVTVFNFTHPPVLSTLLLILSASRFLAPDSPLLVPAPFLLCAHVYALRIVSRDKILIIYYYYYMVQGWLAHYQSQIMSSRPTFPCCQHFPVQLSTFHCLVQSTFFCSAVNIFLCSCQHFPVMWLLLMEAWKFVPVTEPPQLVTEDTASVDTASVITSLLSQQLWSKGYHPLPSMSI